jgi:hypothetical protein
MLNPYFTQGTNNEQDLVQDLVDEQIRMYGIDVHYIPRSYLTKKTVIREVIQSEYNNAYPIEAYVSSYDGYDGAGTLLSKFGIQEQDDLTIVISRRRFENYLQPLLENVENVELSTRPKEGDLIYFPLGDRIFEIKYVEHESPFFQLKKNYVYELRCELYRLEANDVLDTGIVEIDNNLVEEGYIQTLQMVGVGTTASAITTVINGGVRFVDITNRGSGYKQAPIVAFSTAPLGGVTAIGIASMIGGIIDFCDTDQSSLRVQSVELLNPGIGYTVPPMISFTGGGGSGAAATAIIGDGIVGIITVTNGGSGYLVPPLVTFSSPTGIGTTATAVSKINSVGVVTAINIINSGLGYTQPPTITISAPNITSGIGTYVFNEILIGSQSNTEARVRSWNSSTKILEIASVTGTFIKGELLVGQTSNASYAINIINTSNLSDAGDDTYTKDKYASNDEIQIESNKILDFSESNPFGNP